MVSPHNAQVATNVSPWLHSRRFLRAAFQQLNLSKPWVGESQAYRRIRRHILTSLICSSEPLPPASDTHMPIQLLPSLKHGAQSTVWFSLLSFHMNCVSVQAKVSESQKLGSLKPELGIDLM